MPPMPPMRRPCAAHAQHCRIEPFLDQAAPLRGAGSGAPRAGLCLGEARPARPRRPQPVGAADLSTLIRHGMRYYSAPSSSLSIVQLPAAASRAPAASLRDRHTPTLDPAATRRGFAPTRRTGWSSQTGFFLIWQSMTAQVNGFLPSQEPCLWCGDGNRSLRSSREELVAHPLRGASTSSRWWLATLLEIVLSCFDLLVRELQSDFTSSGTLLPWLALPPRGPVIVLAHGFSLTHSFHFWRRAEAYAAAGSRLQLRPAVHRWQRW